MKRLINYVSRKLGYEKINQDKLEIEIATKRWIKSFDINLIFDIGASDGGFARKIKKILPDSAIYCFEPLPKSFKRLTERNSEMNFFFPVNVALSDKTGQMNFYLCENNTGSSSMLEMNKSHKEAYPHTSTNTKMVVNSNTLDLFSKDLDLTNKNILLKLDVQGAEKIVLEGAADTLKHVDLIFCEMNFTTTYNGCVLFGDLNNFLEKNGFILCGIENISQNKFTGEFLQADAYFKKIKK